MAASPRSSSVIQPPTAGTTSIKPRHVPKTSGKRSLLGAACARFPLLIGLMLFMIAGLKASDAAMRSAIPGESEKR
jgi:hypothetical protein